MKCLDSQLKYIEKGGRILHIRYKAHIQAIKDNHSNSEYLNYILNREYKYVTMTDNTGIIRAHKMTTNSGKI
jgi:PleD family two-component response regulator